MTARQADPKPLSNLLDDHHGFDEAFLRHQDALMVRNAAGAAAQLERFARMLLPHLELEEELLLPIFEQRGKAIVGASPAVFHAEHRKIRSGLEDLKRRTAELESCGPGNACQATLRQFLALIDREYLFKDYLKHHDLRERNALYPELDRITTAEERTELWKAIDARLHAGAK